MAYSAALVAALDSIRPVFLGTIALRRRSAVAGVVLQSRLWGFVPLHALIAGRVRAAYATDVCIYLGYCLACPCGSRLSGLDLVRGWMSPSTRDGGLPACVGMSIRSWLGHIVGDMLSQSNLRRLACAGIEIHSVLDCAPV